MSCRLSVRGHQWAGVVVSVERCRERSGVLGRNVAGGNDFREGKDLHVKLDAGMFQPKMVETLVKHLEGRLETVQPREALEILHHLRDFLDMPELLQIAIVCLGAHIEHVDMAPLAMIPERLLAQVLSLASAQGLLRAESIPCTEETIITKPELQRTIENAWASRESGSRERAVKTLVHHDLATTVNSTTMISTLAKYGGNLEHLSIRNSFILQNLETVLENSPRLKSLDLAHNELKAQGIATVLKALQLPCAHDVVAPTRPSVSKRANSKQFARRAECVLPKQPKAISLDLSNTGITNGGIHAFISSFSFRRKNTTSFASQLESLTLRDNPLGDAGVSLVAETLSTACSGISRLDLSRNPKIGPDGLTSFLHAVKHKKFSLAHLALTQAKCDVSKVLQVVFSQNTLGLLTLDLSKNSSVISSQVFSQETLRGVASLDTLDLGGNTFEGDAFERMAESFMRSMWPLLTNLGLAYSGMSLSDAKLLGPALLQAPALRILDVSGNGLAPIGTATFAVLLVNHQKLESLNVSANECDELVAGAFGAALARSATRTARLYMKGGGGGRMRAAGCAALCRGLFFKASALQVLDLSGQGIRSKGCFMLAKVYPSVGESLTHLLLQENSIDQEGADQLALVISAHAKRSTVVDLMCNPIGGNIRVNSKHVRILQDKHREE